MVCRFTDSSSTRDGPPVADCRKARGEHAGIICRSARCGGLRGCTVCYAKFQRTLAKRLPQLEAHENGLAYMAPPLRALREIDFQKLDGGHYDGAQLALHHDAYAAAQRLRLLQRVGRDHHAAIALAHLHNEQAGGGDLSIICPSSSAAQQNVAAGGGWCANAEAV